MGVWTLQADGGVVQLFPNKQERDDLVREEDCPRHSGQ